jgi:hypothetical protein
MLKGIAKDEARLQVLQVTIWTWAEERRITFDSRSIFEGALVEE